MVKDTEMMFKVFEPALDRLLKWVKGEEDVDAKERDSLLKILAAYKALKSTEVQIQQLQWSVIKFTSKNPEELKKFSEIAMPEYVPIKAVGK